MSIFGTTDTRTYCEKNGHEIEPRYDYGAPVASSLSGCTPSEGIRALEASAPKKYFLDICVRCGQVFYIRGQDLHD